MKKKRGEKGSVIMGNEAHLDSGAAEDWQKFSSVMVNTIATLWCPHFLSIARFLWLPKRVKKKQKKNTNEKKTSTIALSIDKVFY